MTCCGCNWLLMHAQLMLAKRMHIPHVLTVYQHKNSSCQLKWCYYHLFIILTKQHSISFRLELPHGIQQLWTNSFSSMRRNNPNRSNTTKSWHSFLLAENCSIHPLICLLTLCRFAFLYDFQIKTNVSEMKKSSIRSSGIRLFSCITRIFGSGMWDNDPMCSLYWFSNKTTDNSMIWNIKVCLREKHQNSIQNGTTDKVSINV